MKIPVPGNLSECILRGAAKEVLRGTTNGRSTLGHMKITHAAKKLFGIHRYPTHPERFCSIEQTEYRELSSAMEGVSDQELESLILELDSVYKEVQRNLKRDYVSGFITLQRRIRLVSQREYQNDLVRLQYGEHVAISVLKAQQDNLPSIDFDTDVVTGWCLNDPGNYGEILIKHEFPIEDVLLTARYIAYESGIESDEWLVLNRQPTGVLKINPKIVTIPAEIQGLLAEHAKKMHWDSLKAFRHDANAVNAKLPLKYFGNHHLERQPWYVKKALAIARWSNQRKSQRC